MSNPQIAELEQQIYQLNLKLQTLRQINTAEPVGHYEFTTQNGTTTLLDLFGEHDKLLMIHNMGQACRYCTLWADGFNGLVAHLESAMSVVLVSKDSPAEQRKFASSRGWRFRLASHGGGPYIEEQSALEGANNMPGAVTYERQGDQVHRKNACVFGPGDQFCPAWDLLSMAGLTEAQWTPQFNYWLPPVELEDGGENVLR